MNVANLTPLERELITALEKLLPTLNQIIERFTLDIPEGFQTLAEDVASAEAVIRKANGGQ